MALLQFLQKAQSPNGIDTMVEKQCLCSVAHMGLHRTSLPDFHGDGNGHCLTKLLALASIGPQNS